MSDTTLGADQSNNELYRSSNASEKQLRFAQRKSPVRDRVVRILIWSGIVGNDLVTPSYLTDCNVYIPLNSLVPSVRMKSGMKQMISDEKSDLCATKLSVS